MRRFIRGTASRKQKSMRTSFVFTSKFTPVWRVHQQKKIDIFFFVFERMQTKEMSLCWPTVYNTIFNPDSINGAMFYKLFWQWRLVFTGNCCYRIKSPRRRQMQRGSLRQCFLDRLIYSLANLFTSCEHKYSNDKCLMWSTLLHGRYRVNFFQQWSGSSLKDVKLPLEHWCAPNNNNYYYYNHNNHSNLSVYTTLPTILHIKDGDFESLSQRHIWPPIKVLRTFFVCFFKQAY